VTLTPTAREGRMNADHSARVRAHSHVRTGGHIRTGVRRRTPFAVGARRWRAHVAALTPTVLEHVARYAARTRARADQRRPRWCSPSTAAPSPPSPAGGCHVFDVPPLSAGTHLTATRDDGSGPTPASPAVPVKDAAVPTTSAAPSPTKKAVRDAWPAHLADHHPGRRRGPIRPGGTPCTAIRAADGEPLCSPAWLLSRPVRCTPRLNQFVNAEMALTWW
jgi:hypothetical protein